LIPGGPTDADIYAGLASLLADEFRVVSYDPRGNSRSLFDDVPVEQDLDVHGDDAAALIGSLGENAYVFGNSGGAQIGLNLSARFPSRVLRLIAHEPPCVALLPDAESVFTSMRKVTSLYRSDGAGPAMAEFMKAAGMTPPRSSVRGDERPRGEPPPRMAKNLSYFLEHGVGPIGNYRPDIEALRSSDVVVGVGRESSGQLAHRTALTLASELGISAVEFPGGHSGWLQAPDAFSQTLRSVLHAR
jgi:pimeloyl-ACP methyl ester carboxylesterase